MDAHIARMARPSNREKILASGLEVVHAHGFAGASVRDIVQAAGVPQGSFTNHFGSKEAFGLEIIDRYCESGRDIVAETLLDDTRSPLARLAEFIDRGKEKLACNEMRDGCLLGNLAAEASHDSEPMREKLDAAFADIAGSIAYCLKAAVEAGEVPRDLDVEGTAAYIVASVQGANLLAKIRRDPAPVDRFKTILFEKVLR
ncbi:TetR family transcriptional regulator C-terminal domain-containing protein [Kaistia geumhonensis]|uniref:TetR/AcrR family transcriptional repressor of nem operon n=1 Tax=Kaistia geumhonensis TaxID=410839 RepID=A0ABU0MCE2_9HYPH|nr:TetR/AcrR family transcriptional regulator [Kaistia geumhonensis]MCX5481569.1 TetR family transcriptional regulator C-terminal domain-containing protein [Kaistia geumhonensis]MDQ0518635.1 TetR/AcrR family transcriptional repressor of nem operon [Kaistia geumhonensis]